MFPLVLGLSDSVGVGGYSTSLTGVIGSAFPAGPVFEILMDGRLMDVAIQSVVFR
jgi:hypothetical protein